MSKFMNMKENLGLLMRMRISGRVVLLVLAALLMAGPGFTLLKYFTITTKKLAHPNPTFYIFHVNAEEMRQTLWKSYCYSCARDAQAACENVEGLGMDSPSKVVMEPGYWRKSETYFWMGRPLDYHADYAVRVAPRGDSTTEVRVETSNAEVAVGPSFGMHGGNLDRDVAPTTVEEYRFLRTIGCAVGEKEMPALELPK
jgi:hypothetical protein